MPDILLVLVGAAAGGVGVWLWIGRRMREQLQHHLAEASRKAARAVDSAKSEAAMRVERRDQEIAALRAANHPIRILRIVIDQPRTPEPVHKVGPEVCIELVFMVLSVQANRADKHYVMFPHSRCDQITEHHWHGDATVRSLMGPALHSVWKRDHNLGSLAYDLRKPRRAQRSIKCLSSQRNGITLRSEILE